MSGFFKVDIDDYFEFWSDQPPYLFMLYSFLLASAWRKPDTPRLATERHFKVTLWQNQLIFHIGQAALKLKVPESTLRNHLTTLEDSGMIRIDNPVGGIKVITVMGVYDYRDHDERIPCTYRAPSVVDLRTLRDRSEHDPSMDLSITPSSNRLDQCKTGILEDSRLKEVENHGKPVNEDDTELETEGVGDPVTAETPFSDDIIEDLAVCLVEKDSSLSPEKAIKEAKRLLTEKDEVWDLD